MSPVLTAAALLVAGAVGGAINAVAGGGSFVVFPAVLFAGVPPVVANATTAAALWPAGITSASAYREYLFKGAADSAHDARRRLVVLSAMSLIGGGLGARLLLVTSDATFARILPLLMLAAASVFTYGPRLTKRTGGKQLPLPAGAFLQLAISTYGGYFGGGMGIMMLATFTLMGMSHIHEMNAMKVLFGLFINGVASIAFLVSGKVIAAVAIPVAIGSIVGGWAGAAIAKRVAPSRVRTLVLAIAWSLTVWFFYRALRK